MNVDIDVPQGNVLGRVLLLSFINYILRNTDKTLSADDTAILAQSFSLKVVLKKLQCVLGNELSTDIVS